MISIDNIVSTTMKSIVKNSDQNDKNDKSSFDMMNQIVHQSNSTNVKSGIIIDQIADKPRSNACLSTFISVWITNFSLIMLIFIKN